MNIDNYEERVYAGVLGKIIGVYLGRPIEHYIDYKRLLAEQGEISYYVNDRFNQKLVVTDDDISGTFTFVRAAEDYPKVTSENIGLTWLNYLIENRTTLWWGGLGNSTEHTAYLRLKSGYNAPCSGSSKLNGKGVSEQIGGQIFIDGWGMVAPGDPDLAARLAESAARVSHDGEAVHAAKVIATIESMAFIENDLNVLLETACTFIPERSKIHRLIRELRELREREPDWKLGRDWIERNHGYHLYPGTCHIVPNHALVIFSLLYGDDDFQRTLMIVNSCGWDTDCNSGNVGCIMGIKNGLNGIDRGPDWRTPVADRLYLPSAEPGSGISDAVAVAYRLVNIHRNTRHLPPLSIKNGSRFHFEMPGALQGFLVDEQTCAKDLVTVENSSRHSSYGNRTLKIGYSKLSSKRRCGIGVFTFVPLDSNQMKSYPLITSPQLYSGQTLRAGIFVDDGSDPIFWRFYIQRYGEMDKPDIQYGAKILLAPGHYEELQWTIPGVDDRPIFKTGLELTGERNACGSLYLDYFTWDGSPDVQFKNPKLRGGMNIHSWINGFDHYPHPCPDDDFRMSQDRGVGMLITGDRAWQDYVFSADLTPHLAAEFGIAVRVRGLQHFLALTAGPKSRLKLVKMYDKETILAEINYPWHLENTYRFEITVNGSRVKGCINDQELFDLSEDLPHLSSGGIGIICREGTISANRVAVRPSNQ